MRPVTIGFMAYDLHELLCHFIASRRGFYEEAGIEPTLVDASFAEEGLRWGPDYFQVACGSAFQERMNGTPVSVVFASVHRPLFWLVTRAGITHADHLRGRTIATFPPFAPPHDLLRGSLRVRGVDPEDVVFTHARDDQARLGLLQEGYASAALVSSGVPPSWRRQHGVRDLHSLADDLTFVSSGLAVHDDVLRSSPELVAAVAGVFRRTLDLIHDHDEAGVDAVSEMLRVPPDEAGDILRDVQPAFTATGKVPSQELQTTLRQLQRETGHTARVDVDQLYRWYED